MKKSLRPFRLLGCVLLLIVGSSAAQATSFHWKDNTVGGLYSDPNNWVSSTGIIVAGPPQAGDDAGFPGQIIEFKAGDASATADVSLSSTLFDLTSGGYNVSDAVTIRNNAILTVYGSGSGGPGNILAAGSIVFNLGDSIEIDTGAQLSAGSISPAGGPAKIYLEGGTATVSGLTTAFIEVDGGSFTTGSVRATGIMVTQPQSQFSVQGDLTTSGISVSGAGSVAHAATALAPGQISVDTNAALSIDGALKIGFAGDGSTLSNLSVKSGGFVASGTAEVPGGSGPTIPISGVGSTWLVNNLLQTGTVANGTVTVNVEDGGEVNAGSLDLSVAVGSNSVVSFDDPGLFGSKLVVTQGPLRVGVGGYAYLGVTNSKVTVSGGAPIQLGVNPGSDGNLGLYGSGGGFGIGAAELNDGDAAIQVGVAGHGAMSVGDGATITTGPVNVAVQPTSGTSDNPCSLNVNGSTSQLTIHGPLVIAKTGATANVSATGGGTLTSQSLLLGVHGSLDVSGGQMVVGSGTVPTTGTLLVAGGGILSGQGRAQGESVVNTSVTGKVVIGAGGTFVPGGDPNVFSVQGDVDLSNGGAGGGATEFELGGAGTAGVDYDQLIVSGQVTLGGTLRLVLLPGYVPKAGDKFNFVTGGSVVGGFAQVVAPGLTVSTAAGASGVSVTVTSVTPTAPPTVTSVTTAVATLGQPFSYQISATNSPAGYTAATLPDGLDLDPATGLIAGVPTAVGTTSIALSATNVGGTGTATLALTVGSAVVAGTPVITSAATAAGQLGAAFSYQITATNAPTGFTAVGLPDGLTLDAASGLISGTPTATGTFNVTLGAFNAVGGNTAPLTLTVASVSPTVTLTAAIPSVTAGSGEFGEFLLTLDQPAGADLHVNLVIKGTAINGQDYTLLNTSKKIKAGKTSKAIKIKPQGDLDGVKKTVKLTLAPGDGYTVGTTDKAKVKILPETP